MSLAAKIVDFLERHARSVVILATLLTIASGVVASNLVLEADLQRLLPESAPTVQGLHELEERYGYVGRVTIALDGKDAETLEAAVDDLEVHLLEADKRLTRVEGKRPVDFFESHKLLYVELEDIEKAAERLRKRIKWEKKQANPLFASLKDEEPPEVNLDDITSNYKNVNPESYVHNDDKTRYLVYAFADFPAADMDQSKELMANIEPFVEERVSKFEGVEVGFTGRYKKRVEQQVSLTNDLGQATVVAIVLLTLFLLFFFRGFRASFLVVIPLLMGTAWAFAWAYLVFSSLNILTGFFGAIILGLGIDYGIHVMSRYLEARHEGLAPRDALVTTLNSAGRASVYAGMTTVIAFGSLASSSFQAFFEFGIIALGGMTLIVAANVVVLPAILFLVADTKLEPKRTMNAKMAARFQELPPLSTRRFRAGIMLVAAAVICAVALTGLPNIGIEYDMAKIQASNSPAWDLDEEVAEMVDLSLIPAVVLADSPEHAARIAAEARNRMETLPAGAAVQNVLTLQDLVPAKQAEKLEVLEGLREDIERLPKKVRTEGELADPYQQLVRTIEAGPVTVEKLPVPLRAPFEMKEGEEGATVLIFPSRNLTDADIMFQLAEIAYDLPPGTPDAEPERGINDALILLDIIALVERDGVRMLAITIFGLLFTAFVAFRRPRRILMLVITISAAILAALGVIGLLGVKFNFINLMVLPIWLGLGVDATFHLMVRCEESPGDLAGFVATMLAVSAAFITSMIGFGSMFVTEHTGLYTMGIAAVAGLGTIAVVSMLIQGAVFLRLDENDD